MPEGESQKSSRIIGQQRSYREILEDEDIIVAKQSLLLQSQMMSSNVEVPQEELSGDENDEKAMQTSVLQSNYYGKAQKKTQNVFFASVTVMKTIVGSGILGLPSVMKNWGIIMGTIFFVSIFLINQYTVQILLKTKNISKRSNLSTIGQSIFGQNIKYIINIIVITNNIGICMVEMVIFGNTGSNLLDLASEGVSKKWYGSFEFLTFCSAVLISPLIFVKSIEKLRHVALLAIASIFFFAIATIVTYVEEIDNDKGKINYWIPESFSFTQSMGQLPVLFLAFGYQFNLFPIYKSVAQPSDKKGKLVSFFGLFASLTLYLIVAIMGYLAYGNTVEVDYLKSIDKNSLGTTLYILLNMSFVISTIFSFPVMFFGARNNLLSLIADILSSREQNKIQKLMDKSSIHKSEKYTKSNILISKKNTGPKNDYDGGITGIKFYIITTIMYVVAVTVAIVVGDIDPIFNVIGSIDATSISYLLPCGFYIGLNKKRRQKRFHYYISIVIMIVSSILALTCLVCNYFPDPK